MDPIPGSVHLKADRATSRCVLTPQGQLLVRVARVWHGVHMCVTGRPLAVLGSWGGRYSGWLQAGGQLSVLSHSGAKFQGVQEF